MLEYIHNNAMELIIITMTVGLIGACYCTVMALYYSIKYDKELKKKELKKKVDLVLFMASNTNENDYYKACENLGLCTKTSVTELIFGVHYE